MFKNTPVQVKLTFYDMASSTTCGDMKLLEVLIIETGFLQKGYIIRLQEL